jgi:tagatose 6-phosphate kinase
VARVVVLTPNPAIDVTYRVAEQLVGETVRVLEVQRRAGGKGINVVRVLRSLGVGAPGFDVTAVQPLGGAAGDWLRARLADDGIDAVSVDAPDETRTTVAVVDGLAHPTLYAEPGGALDTRTWQGLVDAIGTHCESGCFLVIAGSFPPGSTPDRVASLVAAGRGAGASVIVDASGAALIAAADAGADIVKPNESELLEATGEPELEAGIAQLLARGAGSVVVSRGPDGLVLVSADGYRETQAGVPGVSAGNPTGAGDAATAGLVSALAAGASARAALRRAAVVGAAAVLSPTAGDIDPDTLASLESRLDPNP